MSSLAHHMDTKITHLFCFHPYGNSLHCIICLPLHNISACYLHTTCFTHSVNRHIFVYEIPLPFKNIYSPIPPTRHKGIFLTKIMPVFQEKKKVTKNKFNAHLLVFSPHRSSASPRTLLFSSHFREILTNNIYTHGLYFITAAHFSYHPLHFPAFSFTA